MKMPASVGQKQVNNEKYSFFSSNFLILSVFHEITPRDGAIPNNESKLNIILEIGLIVRNKYVILNAK